MVSPTYPLVQGSLSRVRYLEIPKISKYLKQIRLGISLGRIFLDIRYIFSFFINLLRCFTLPIKWLPIYNIMKCINIRYFLSNLVEMILVKIFRYINSNLKENVFYMDYCNIYEICNM